MSEENSVPQVVETSPIVLALEPKKYAYCACGLSEDGIFCDGSHRGTTLRPVIFEVTERQETVAICRCKQSKNPPFCDGSHQNL